MKKSLLIGFRMFAFMSLLTGIVYPALISFYAQNFENEKANGSIVFKNKDAVGSALIGQSFSASKYFWSRPSSVDYNSTGSGASNLGPTSKILQEQFNKRKNELSLANETSDVPQDLLFSSASGLDPHISPESAHAQVKRISKIRKIDIGKVRQLVQEFTEVRQYGIFGEPRVNVLLLNLELDKLFGAIN